MTADRTNILGKYNVFLSYRREGGEAMAILLRDRLTAKGYRVFLDIESLNAGSFNTKLLSVIDGCTDIIVICSKNSFDRCANEDDWVRLEIAHALKHGKNIVPVMLRGFEWPGVLPGDIDALRVQNGINAGNNEYFDAMIDRLAEKFLQSAPEIEYPKGPAKKPAGKKSILITAASLVVAAVLVACGIKFFTKTEPAAEFITIKGTEYSTSLFEIILDYKDLSNVDIAPLKHMRNLEVLNLGGNQISDLTPLAGLTSLKELYLYDNGRIADLTPLSKLSELTRVSLYWNNISDITPLSGLEKLEWLDLSGNPIADWSPVEHVKDVGGRPRGTQD